MDISELGICQKLAAGEAYEYLHPGTGEGLGLTVRIQGYDCDAVEAAAREVSRRVMDKKGKTDLADLNRLRKVAMAQAAVTELVDGFTGSVTTLEQFRAFMADHEDGKFFVEQTEQFGGNRASFFGNAGTP